MKLCRFNDNCLGVVEGSTVRDVTAALDALPSWRYPLPRYDPLYAHLAEVQSRIQSIAPRAPVLPLDSIRLLSPVANPTKIIAAPVNYEKHLVEVKGDAQLH